MLDPPEELSGQTGSFMYMSPEMFKSEAYNEKVENTLSASKVDGILRPMVHQKRTPWGSDEKLLSPNDFQLPIMSRPVAFVHAGGRVLIWSHDHAKVIGFSASGENALCSPGTGVSLPSSLQAHSAARSTRAAAWQELPFRHLNWQPENAMTSLLQLFHRYLMICAISNAGTLEEIVNYARQISNGYRPPIGRHCKPILVWTKDILPALIVLAVKSKDDAVK
eukprot:1160680-Pelagomonas_calceolata.AAC.5